MEARSYSTGARWRPGVPPGLYEDVVVVEAPQDVAMDVTAFIGLTERGPVGVPVAVDSWADMLRLFGRPGGGRLLPQCVQLFFANGGRRAVIVRVLDYGLAVTARFRAPWVGDGVAPLELEARDPGVWGDRLSLSWSWVRGRAHDLVFVAPDRMRLSSGVAPREGTLLRRTRRQASGSGHVLNEDLVFVREVQGDNVLLEGALSAPAPGETVGLIEAVQASLEARLDGQVMRWDGLGLHPGHPDAIHRRLNQDPEAWVRVAHRHAARPLTPTESLLSAEAWTRGRELSRVRGGSDAADTTSRWHVLLATDPARTLDEDHLYRLQPEPLEALIAYDDVHQTEPVSLICTPDLLHLQPGLRGVGPPRADVSTVFSPCGLAEELGTPPSDGAYPLLSSSALLEEVSAVQAELVRRLDRGHQGAGYGRIALLDVRPGASADDLVRWRREVTSETGLSAAYAPWLECAPSEDPLLPRMLVPPCGAVAGVIARQERSEGVHRAPANTPVVGIVRPYADPMLPDVGFLHEERVNLIRTTERGPRVMGARTTTYEPEWTHLSVRRLVHYLCRQIETDNRWAIFEPHDHTLWRRLHLRVEQRLTALYRANALAGPDPARSWFVRCDETVNPSSVQDRGQVVVLVGIAPAVPAEFLVFRVALQREGPSREEERHG